MDDLIGEDILRISSPKIYAINLTMHTPPPPVAIP